jgi:energy-coupling factor transport system substrate-specific component
MVELEQIERPRFPSARNKTARRWFCALIAFPLGNVALNRLVIFTDLPLFFDSIFTALCAALFGLGPALATAVLTNGGIEVATGFPGTHLPFAVCGMATAWIVSRAAARNRFSASIHVAAAILEVSLANALLGALIASLVYGGYTAVNIDVAVSAIQTIGGNIFSAVFLARLPTNIVDKGIAVGIAVLGFKLASSGRMSGGDHV